MYKALSHGVQPVAVKVFPLTANAEQHAEFQREVVLLKSCRDGNIVQVSLHASVCAALLEHVCEFDVWQRCCVSIPSDRTLCAR